MKNKHLNHQQMQHIAQLAALQLNEQVLAIFQPQLENILKYMNQLQSLPTKNNHNTQVNSVNKLQNIMREDKTEKSLNQTQALQNTNNHHKGCVVVPGVIDKNTS